MTKTIIVDGKEIILKTNGLVPILYKREFKKDFFSEIHSISKNDYNIEVMYNLVWLFAHIADNTIGTMEEWLSSFDTFPVTDFIGDIIDLTTACITSKNQASKKKTVKVNR